MVTFSICPMFCFISSVKFPVENNTSVGVLDNDDGNDGNDGDNDDDDDDDDDGKGWSGCACARYAERSRGKCLIGLA